MATCGSLHHIFEKPLPENPSLLESLSPSWKQIKPIKPVDHSFTEIFGELHFKENPEPSPAAAYSSSFVPTLQTNVEKLEDHKNENNSGTNSSSYSRNGYGAHHKSSDSCSSMNAESLKLCTEGLGFESFDDVEDMKNEIDSCSSNGESNNNNSPRSHRKEETEKVYVWPHSDTEGTYMCSDQHRIANPCGRIYPPPISCIRRSGKPWVCFKSYRQDGRFVLQEVRIPTQESLHACREDGRLRLSLVQSDDDSLEDEEEEVEYPETMEDEGMNGVCGKYGGESNEGLGE